MSGFIQLKILTISFLLLSPACVRGLYWLSYKDLVCYWGQSFRPGDGHYNSWTIARETYKSVYARSHFRSFGVRMDNFGNNNNAFSTRYCFSPIRFPDPIITPYIGTSAVCNIAGQVAGFMLKPEIGLRYNPTLNVPDSKFNIILNLSYGYDISIVGSNDFRYSRHDISFKIGLAYRLNGLAYLCKGLPSSPRFDPEYGIMLFPVRYHSVCTPRR